MPAWWQWIEGLGLEEPFVLVAHSLGGYLSLQLALQFPERLRGLFLIDPLFSPEQIPEPVVRAPQMLDFGQKMLHAAPEKMVERVLNRTFEPYSPMPEASRRQKTRDLLRASRQVTRLVRGRGGSDAAAGRDRAAGVVVWGARDRVLYPKTFPKLVAPLPNAQGFPLEGCGHHPHLEKPEEVNGMVREFTASFGLESSRRMNENQGIVLIFTNLQSKKNSRKGGFFRKPSPLHPLPSGKNKD